MRYLLCIFTLLLFNPLMSQEEESANPPVIAIKIPLGDTVNIDGIEISFSEVLEDSRCPTNVDCIWEGRARISVSVSGNVKELIFGAVRQGEVKDNTLIESEAFKLEGFELAPYPEESGQELNYVLLVKKTVN